ncbi:hypothetical protein NJ76_31430 [Rhodococcus sp. IITR03]|nr:hypothetical protein NJ76_31430 [Rhodococcus sp. IITR03]
MISNLQLRPVGMCLISHRDRFQVPRRDYLPRVANFGCRGPDHTQPSFGIVYHWCVMAENECARPGLLSDTRQVEHV